MQLERIQADEHNEEFTGITQPECFNNSDEWITRGSDALVGDAPSTDEAWVTELSSSNVE